MGATLGSWWNRRTGMGCRQIWAEERDDGRIEIRWAAGIHGDRTGRIATGDPAVALAKVRELIEQSGFPVADWIDRTTAAGRSGSPDPATPRPSPEGRESPT